MKHVKTLNTQTMNSNLKKSGCGECQTSCQSACKTSCTVGNQTCEQKKQFWIIWNTRDSGLKGRCFLLFIRMDAGDGP